MRARRDPLLTLALPAAAGVLLITISGLLAWHELRQEPTPESGSDLALGLVVPVVAPGLYAVTTIHTHDCDSPVDVAVTIGGSFEYWRAAQAAMPQVAGVAFAISGAPVEDLQLRMGNANEQHGTEPGPAPAGPALAPADVLLDQRVRRVAAGGYAATVETVSVRAWARHQAPLVATFRADWIVRRSSGTCFLRLPTLTGPGLSCVLAAVEHGLRSSDALVRRLPDGFRVCDPVSTWTAHGATVVNPDGASVDVGGSEPPPTSRSSQDDTVRWACRAETEQPHPVIPPPPYHQHPIVRPPNNHELTRSEQPPADCSGVAILAEDDGLARSGFGLLLYGALLGIGVSLVVESGLQALRRRVAIRDVP